MMRRFASCCVIVLGWVAGGGASAAFGMAHAEDSEIRVVATFESLGIYWKPETAPSSDECALWYREAGATDWRDGHPLWFDARNGECRGSLVHLMPGTEYDIGVAVDGDVPQIVTAAATWREEFPIGQTIHLPETSSSTFVIDGSGTPDAYLLYTFEPSKSATIDVHGQFANNIVVAGSYVIIRGLNLRNAGRDAILLSRGVHDVVIEDNDISGWGRIDEDGWGKNRDAAIAAPRASEHGPARIIIQRNRIHHPRTDSNAWDEYRELHDTFHPRGAHAVYFWNSVGNHVIRYNEIYSDDDHRFNDCLGGGANFSTGGFPNRDSDIYGNHIRDCWDDAIESEGANANVRIWGNYMDRTYVMVAVAATQVGPVYIWRNVADRSRRNAKQTMLNSKRGVFLKTQSQEYGGRYWGDGRIYVYHNTMRQYPNEWRGVSEGLSDMAGALMTNVVSRNNILHVTSRYRPGIADRHRLAVNDFDYDLYSGVIMASEGQQKNGIKGEPIYAHPHDRTVFVQAPESPGYDAGVPLANFNDDFVGEAPDIGAQETGRPLLRFGLEAAESGWSPASN